MVGGYRPDVPIYFYWTGQEFDFANYLAVASAELHTNGPVVLFVDERPVDNPHFDRLSELAGVSVEPVDVEVLMSEEQVALYRDLSFPAHRADLVRFVVLFQRGGLFLDTDVIVRRSLDELPARLLLTDGKIVPVGVMALPAGDELAGRMLDELVAAPREEFDLYPSIVHRWTKVVRAAGDAVRFGELEAFLPVYWRDWESIFQPDGWARPVDSIHVLHHYGYFSRSLTAEMDERWVAEHPCLFSTIAAPVLKALASRSAADW